MGPSSPALLPTSCMGATQPGRSRGPAESKVTCAILYGASQSVLCISNAVTSFAWCSSSPKCVVLGQTSHTQCMGGLGPSKLLASGYTPSSHLGMTLLMAGLTPHRGYQACLATVQYIAQPNMAAPIPEYGEGKQSTPCRKLEHSMAPDVPPGCHRK